MRQYCVAHDVVRRLVEARFARTDLPLEDEQREALAEQLQVSTASSPEQSPAIPRPPPRPPSPAAPRPPLGRPSAAPPGLSLAYTLSRPLPPDLPNLPLISP